MCPDREGSGVGVSMRGKPKSMVMVKRSMIMGTNPIKCVNYHDQGYAKGQGMWKRGR